MIVIFVMNRQFMQIFAAKSPPAAATYPGMESQRLLAVPLMARQSGALRLGHGTVKAFGIDLLILFTAFHSALADSAPFEDSSM